MKQSKAWLYTSVIFFSLSLYSSEKDEVSLRSSDMSMSRKVGIYDSDLVYRKYSLFDPDLFVKTSVSREKMEEGTFVCFYREFQVSEDPVKIQSWFERWEQGKSVGRGDIPLDVIQKLFVDKFEVKSE